jgi:two-component system phosphate regulon sensor histidine kinase PhoR
MHFLIDDISELSSIETGNVKIEIQKINLHNIVKEVFATLEAKAEKREITLENDIPKKTFVKADYLRLEQMLTNLADNAIKFNSQTGIVTVSYEQEESTDIIKVSDTGEGIMREHLQRIFERFYRIDHSRTREIGGTGLGLAIVKHLARLHKGEVNVTSILGEGTTFSISIPK